MLVDVLQLSGEFLYIVRGDRLNQQEISLSIGLDIAQMLTNLLLSEFFHIVNALIAKLQNITELSYLGFKKVGRISMFTLQVPDGAMQGCGQ